MSINLFPLKDDGFFQFQADVIPEEQIIAKIYREVQDRRYSGLGFNHLTEEENRKVNRYELIQFFKPFKYPIITAVFVGNQGQVLAEKTPRYDVQFRKIGQAQIWYGEESKQCVLWECLVYSIFPEVKTQAEKVWRWLLAYIKQLGMERIYTHDFDPAYPTGYPRFLKSLGFNYTEKPRIMMQVKETT